MQARYTLAFREGVRASAEMTGLLDWLADLGQHELKGVAQKQQVYGA